MNAQHWIQKLQLLKHPEGGYFKETYRSKDNISTSNGERSICTSIYFLLGKNDFSTWHQLQSDELWHYHQGVDLNIYIINPVDKTLTVKTLGCTGDNAQLQILVPKQTIFSARPVSDLALLDENSVYSLVGCTMSCGFDFADFRMVGKAELLGLGLSAQHNEIISALARLE